MANRPGTAGNDSLTGTTAADTFWGYGGNDTMDGLAGNDTMYGGTGNDLAYGGAGADRIEGEAGADVLYGGADNDSLFGGNDNDTLYGDAGNDSLDGGAGNDVLDGGDGNDTLVGGDGNDTLIGAGADYFNGGAGLDIVDYSASDAAVNVSLTTWTGLGGHAAGDTFAGVDGLIGSGYNDTLIGYDGMGTGADAYTNHISGGMGNDHIEGLSGDDSLYGGGDNDTVYGGIGNDTVEGGDGNDSVYGDDGNDIVRGDRGTDQVFGGAGNDTLYGGDDNDSLYGGADSDTLYGDDGNDRLYGGAGADSLYGGAGNDSLYADGGNDTLFGGAGNDVFYINTTTGQILIADFGAGNTGPITDGSNLNNDFVDLTAYYNYDTLRAWNAAHPGQTYADPMQWMHADFADGVLNAVGGGLRIQNGGVSVGVSALNTETTGVVCFTRGTRIATPRGEIAVEDLVAGDLVLTLDQGPQMLRWIGSRRVAAEEMQADPGLRPVRIRAGALGHGLPHRDLVVSQQHRFLLASRIVSRLFTPEGVLLAAKHMTGCDGVAISDAAEGTEYFHLLFDAHQVVLAEGAAAESFLPGPEAQKMLRPGAMEEILAVLPWLATRLPEPARPLLKGREGRDLMRRHLHHGLGAWDPTESAAPDLRHSA
ncbi:Hint domain-containing protein [Pseudogemmobacter bohemicus]|uniref:Hint domain-containing protein n=1 Tax=Pseudogemmobacter bohemicus TaxID=2250708 RepID=UPI000DD3331A|nr:Hint domain-containing protein [Pseudogemmobacter bohemicus]